MQGTLRDIFQPFSDDFKAFDEVFQEIMTSDIKIVDQIAKFIVKHKGKQFRPALVVVSASAVSNINRNTYVTAAVVELLHTATLIHDDVLDDAELRRGFRAIHKVWRNKLAILMGDYLLSKSLIAATEIGDLRVMNSVATVAKRLIKGAMFEIQKSRKLDITEADYFRMIADKTASLMTACCELGALSVGATAEQCQAMSDFGENLGMAFQIRDDLLDYEASSGLLGKPAMADLKDKKVTLPLLYACQNCDEKMRKRIFKTVKRGVEKNDLEDILQFIKANNGIEKSRQKALEFKDRAVAALNILPDSLAKKSLIDLAELVVTRKK